MAVSSLCSYSGAVDSSSRSRAKSAPSVSDWELTETYSPAAMDMAPATRPVMPAIRTPPELESAAATPTIKLAVETIPSLAPMTAARSHPTRWVRWLSECLIGADAASGSGRFELQVPYELLRFPQERDNGQNQEDNKADLGDPCCSSCNA